MKIDTTITISIILAICALFAPSITAMINNRHLYKMRKLELQHDKCLHFADLEYRNKYEVYQNLINAICAHYGRSTSFEDHKLILPYLRKALILCDASTFEILLEFESTILTYAGPTTSKYNDTIRNISTALNRELSALSAEYDD